MKKSMLPMAIALMFASAGAMAHDCDMDFGSVDVDGDGRMTSTEFNDYYMENGIYDDWDADDDDFLDEDEFSDGLFDFYDADNDDYIDDIEWEDGYLMDDAGDDGFWDV